MRKTITIETILGGEQTTEFFARTGEFLSSYGIDPDFPKTDSALQTSGFIRPTAMAKFSGSTVTGVPLWILTNPKTNTLYSYANDGKVHSISSSLAMNADVATLATSSGNGSAYYDNYIYFARNTDVARYGPLNGVPTLTTDYWTNALAKTALSNTTYPSLRGIQIPNHVMHKHSDNKLYFTDVVGNEGVLHYIKTTKTTVEGDTNDGSSYDAIDFPLGVYPTAIETYGTDLAVALIEGTDTTIKQRRAKVAFWDTTSSSFNKIIDVEFPDPIITAMKNINGALYVWSGNASGGVRVSRFLGGYSFEEMAYFEEGVPPFAGAVDAEMSRVLWGGYITDPESVAVVKALGSKIGSLGRSIFTPFKASSSNTSNQIVTAVKFVEQSNNSKLRPIIGWSDGAGKGLDSLSTTYTDSRWDSTYFRIGKPFQIVKVRIPLAQTLAANMTLTPTVNIDSGLSSSALNTVNNTNYPSVKEYVTHPQSVYGKHNFSLSLKWTGTALLTVALPITIELDISDE